MQNFLGLQFLLALYYKVKDGEQILWPVGNAPLKVILKELIYTQSGPQCHTVNKWLVHYYYVT